MVAMVNVSDEAKDEFPCILPVVDFLRVDISTDPDFTSKGWGRRVKALGGHFSAARGYQMHRYVHIPCNDRGLALAADIVETFGGKKPLVIFEYSRSVDMPTGQFYFQKGSENPLSQLLSFKERFESSYRVWWDANGRPEAQRKAALEVASANHLRKIAPQQVEDMIHEALRRGCSVAEVSAAVARALPTGP